MAVNKGRIDYLGHEIFGLLHEKSRSRTQTTAYEL